jgi:thiosulfate/3-mercaptopyruvate sulfurtransferase
MGRFAGWILAFLVPVAALAAPKDAIIDANATLRAATGGAILWDVRRLEDYDRGHIPGAVNIGHVAHALLDEKTQLFLPTAQVERRLGNAGLDPRKPIVVYGTRGSSYAHFAAWALTYFGAKNVRVFHDGYEGWVEARRHTSTRATGRSPIKLKLTTNPKVIATTDEVVARLGDPNVQFLDVRRPSEWSGQESETLHSGHLPGATLVPYNAAYVDPEAPARLMRQEIQETDGMALKPDAELLALYAALDPARETIVYCHTGIRAALTANVLERLGFRNVKVYLASWLEYGNRLEARVEK